MEDVLLTFDVDWAPDFMIDDIATRLVERGVRATWFVTHASPAIDRLRSRPELFELGIHPNFLPGSTHGGDTAAVLEHITAVVPEAVSMRSHCVVQSGPLLAEVVERTRIRIDSSIFLPEMPHIRLVTHLTPHGRLLRVPFFWADDYEMLKPEPAWRAAPMLETPGLKVLMFHPVHIALNSPDAETWARTRAALPPLQELTRQGAAAHAHAGDGARTLFERIVEHNGASGLDRVVRDLQSAAAA